MKMSIFKPLMAGMVVAMMAGLMSCEKLDEKPFGVSEDFDRHGEVKSSVQNPYDFVGKDFLAYIEFIKENERSIFDPNSPCTINDQPSCATTFDIEDKLVHHGVCVATGGIGAVAAWVGFGIAIASVFESC